MTNRYIKSFLFLLFLAFSPMLSAQDKVEVFIADFYEEELRAKIEANASSFLTKVNTAFFAKAEVVEIDGELAESYEEAFATLWTNTPFYVPESSIIESVMKLTSGRYEVRNLPVYFVDPEGEEHYEEAVLQFTPSGLISEFRVGLEAHRYQEIMQAGEDVMDQANRETILSFVENFRTAYNRKDVDYIRNVFSDQALIIVGRVVESTGESSAYEKQVEYLRFTKDEYVDRLVSLFDRNEWIDVGYEEISIYRHPKFPEIYGVSLTQFYRSSTYADEGYLFLLIDFKDPEKPMIHVRTWQPKKETPEDEVFHIGFMEIF